MDSEPRLEEGSRVCVFCQIVQDETTAHVVLSEEHSIAFLDRRPLFVGHTLLVPRVHTATLALLDERLVGPLFSAARRLARAVEEALEADGSFVAINNGVSQSVPHLHVHVVPRRKGDGLRGFFWPRQKYESDAAMAETAAKIRATLT
jgi:histidine triad (HIT) family protein